MMSRRSILTGAAALTAALSLPVALASRAAAATALIPAPTGPHFVGARHLQLTDAARSELFPNGTSPRRFMVGAWYPTNGIGTTMPYASASWWNDMLIGNQIAAGMQDPGMASNITGRLTHARLNAGLYVPAGATTLPTVILDPGFGMPRYTFAALAEDLASHGYLVLVLGHTFESMVEDTPQGLKYQYQAQLSDWYWRTALVTRIGDLTALLNQLTSLPNGIGAAARPTEVGVVGHSYGGVAAFSVADTRIVAIAALDSTAGWEYDGAMHGTASGLPCNSLSLSLENDPQAGITYPGWAEMIGQGLNGHNLYDLRVVGAKHHAFNDLAVLTTSAKRAAYVGTITPLRAVDLTRSYVRGFLDGELIGAPFDPRLTLADPAWPEVAVH